MTKTVTISCNSGDCWSNKDDDFEDGSDGYLYIIDDPSETNANVRTWLPFTIPLRKVIIEQAFLKITPYANGSSAGDILISCELAINPANPTTGEDLNDRTLTSNKVSVDMGSFTANTEKSYQIDNPVGEVMTLAAWQKGSVLAVVIQDDGIGEGARQIYSYEGDSSKRARLQINYTEYNNNISYFY
jgi:hypothetical protein